LKNKPPIQPANSELNNLLTEKENLLAVIQEKVKIIQQLEVRLKKQVPQAVIKEVDSGEIIQSLKDKLAKKEEKTKYLHLIYLLLLGMSILVSLARLVKKRRLKEH